MLMLPGKFASDIQRSRKTRRGVFCGTNTGNEDAHNDVIKITDFKVR